MHYAIHHRKATAGARGHRHGQDVHASQGGTRPVEGRERMSSSRKSCCSGAAENTHSSQQRRRSKSSNRSCGSGYEREAASANSSLPQRHESSQSAREQRRPPLSSSSSSSRSSSSVRVTNVAKTHRGDTVFCVHDEETGGCGVYYDRTRLRAFYDEPTWKRDYYPQRNEQAQRRRQVHGPEQQLQPQHLPVATVSPSTSDRSPDQSCHANTSMAKQDSATTVTSCSSAGTAVSTLSTRSLSSSSSSLLVTSPSQVAQRRNRFYTFLLPAPVVVSDEELAALQEQKKKSKLLFR